MITNAPNVANQVQPGQTYVRMSRIRALRILGGAQIGLGVICIILGVVGVILSDTEKNKRCQSNYNYNSGYDYMYYYYCDQAPGILILYLICMALSSWFILTGSLPLFMTGQRQSSWKCLTVAFLVCNILSAVVFSTTVFALAMVGYIIIPPDSHAGSIVTVFAILAIVSGIELITSIVAASHCCCCSQLNIGNQQSVIYIHTVQPEMMHNMPNTHIPTRNQHEYDQLWQPEMAGYNGQQPNNITNNQQQLGHLQGNRMPIQDYHRQQSQPFTMPTQQQNTHQLVYSPEAAGYTTIHEVNNNI